MPSDIGHFQHRVLTSTYTPDISVHHPYHTPLGLVLQTNYYYGGWREADGTLHVFERKFTGPMTAGLWLMNARGGKVSVEPVSASTVRGEVKREYSDDRTLMHGSLMDNVGGGGGGLELETTQGHMKWREGDVLSLDGSLVGPGVQIYAPDEEQPVLYISQLYRVSGRVLGDDVEGFVFCDHVYWRPGYDWKEYVVFKELQLGWEAFANEYEDGSIEWGHLCLGAAGFNFAAVADQNGGVALDDRVTGGLDLVEDDWVPRGRYKTSAGLEYAFDMEEGGKLSEFSAARWGGYRAQCGETRRVGDDRKLKLGFTWMETFGDRIRENKIPSVDDA
jgi:hypothetical protein